MLLLAASRIIQEGLDIGWDESFTGEGPALLGSVNVACRIHTYMMCPLLVFVVRNFVRYSLLLQECVDLGS
jgi:hypothetical protein